MEFYSDSSWIDYVKYDPKNGNMDIFMNGKKYSFINVPKKLYLEFKKAESHGKFYNINIKNVPMYQKKI